MWIDRKALIGRSIWRNDKYIYIRFDGLLILETNLHKSKIRWPVVPPGRRSLPAKTPSNFWLLFWWLRAELDWMNTYIGENTKDKYETSRNRFNRVYVTLVSTLFHSSNSNSLSCLKKNFLKNNASAFLSKIDSNPNPSSFDRIDPFLSNYLIEPSPQLKTDLGEGVSRLRSQTAV